MRLFLFCYGSWAVLSVISMVTTLGLGLGGWFEIFSVTTSLFLYPVVWMLGDWARFYLPGPIILLGLISFAISVYTPLYKKIVEYFHF